MKGVKGFIDGHKHTKETKEKISKALSKKIKFKCDMCGIECEDKPSSYLRKKRHFCKRACYSRYRKEVMKPCDQNSYKNGGMSDKEKMIRVKARSAVNHAVRDGRLLRLPCRLCGEEKTEGHHEDYSKPLDVVWLCKPDHHKVHENPELLTPTKEE